MNWFKKVARYYTHNPEGYWFKRKLYGFGWVPVKWQGWLVVALSLVLVFGGVYVAEIDDAPGAALLGFVLAAALVITTGIRKGETLRWQWGVPENDNFDK